MPGKRPRSQKIDLALAIAKGTSVAEWARGNKVPKRTAYRWAREPKVLAAIRSYRRRALDRAIGRMAGRATWAVDGIAKLAKTAESESVRLAALRSILSDMMGATYYADLEQRLEDLTEQRAQQTESTGSPD